jgi:hypothetical protein
VDVKSVCEGCSLFVPNPQKPPPDNELPIAISQVLQKWMMNNPFRIRHTLPVIQNGNMIGLFVWWDRMSH